MGSKSRFENEQPSAQTQAGNPVVLNIDGYKSKQAVTVVNTVTDLGSVNQSFNLANRSLNLVGATLDQVMDFADEAKADLSTLAMNSANAGVHSQEEAASSIADFREEFKTDDSSRVERVTVLALLAVLVAAFAPAIIKRVGV